MSVFKTSRCSSALYLWANQSELRYWLVEDTNPRRCISSRSDLTTPANVHPRSGPRKYEMPLFSTSLSILHSLD